MAAKPTTTVRFMATSTGKVHVVQSKAKDDKDSKCPVVKKGHAEGKWGRKKGVSPDAALAMDECTKCGSHEVARMEVKGNKTPDEKRAEAKDKRNETLRKASGEKLTDRKGKRGHSTPKGSDRSDRPSGGGMKRRGPKSNRPETMMEKAQEHATFAKEHGWSAIVEETATNEVTVTAEKGKQTLKIIWQDGRTTFSRVVLENGVEVKLRNSANWKKHASGESKIKGDYQPRSRDGSKKALKSQVIDDDAPRKLPFNCDDEDADIITALKGKGITWRMTITKKLDSATVPTRSRNVRITAHPKSGRKMISFHEFHGEGEHGELLGPERTVYLDKILKVR